MHGKTKAGVPLFAMLLLAAAGPTLATSGGAASSLDPGTPAPAAARPNTGINTDGHFPPDVDPICGVRITVYGSQPVNFYTGGRNPWGAPVIAPGTSPGSWTVTFGDPVSGPCFSRNDDIFKECGVFKGLHFGFYTDDPIVNLLNPNTGIWSNLGPPCVYFGPNGEVPCSGLSSHSTGNVGLGQVEIINASPNAAASAKDVGQALKIQNVRIAVAPDLVAINDLGPCALKNLQWQDVQLTESLLPASTEGNPGTLTVKIPENIRAQSGWAVMVYDVTDLETGEVLTTSTLDFPLHQE